MAPSVVCRKLACGVGTIEKQWEHEDTNFVNGLFIDKWTTRL